MKDHYDILGISSNATQDEIKKAYRDKVRYWHPDINKSKEAHERIVEINNAYAVLSDPEERRYYDFYRANDTYTSQQDYTYTNYKPPQYKTNREKYKQERQFNAEWGKVFFFIVFVIFAIVRFSSSSNNTPNFNDVKVIIRESSTLNSEIQKLANKINLENVEIDETKISKPQYLALYAQYDTSFNYNYILSSELNNTPYLRLNKDDIKTIIVYKYIKSERFKENNIPYQDVKIFFIDPLDLKVYKIRTYQNNSSVIVPFEGDLKNFIIKN